MRVGFGYDSHRFAPGRRLVLGGVEITHERGLDGWSDADVIAHAVIDALCGAASLGDIGRLFPPGDPRYRDASSVRLLASVAGMVAAAGFDIVNVDVTVIAEQPLLKTHIPRMQQELGAAMGIDAALATVKAKTNEGMGFVGRGEGIAACSVVLIETRKD
jgi:2-C-methyl-D-erythritol 2,4-cyclodiphosphate synthase